MSEQEWEEYYLPKCPDEVRRKYQKMKKEMDYIKGWLMGIYKRLSCSEAEGMEMSVTEFADRLLVQFPWLGKDNH
jgi:hypothetical protein